MNPVYEAQLMTYLRLSNVRLGFLINFNVSHLKEGIKRMVVYLNTKDSTDSKGKKLKPFVYFVYFVSVVFKESLWKINRSDI